MVKSINKIIISLTAICLLFTATFFIPKKYSAAADGVAEIAVELNCGRIFHEKNADKKLPMASTTKIMTALIIAEDCNLSEVITVPDEAVGVEGSSIYLKHGEKISIRDLLYGLMLRSGNDAACALAIYHSGSIAEFVKVMNARAKSFGCNGTNFANPNGLPDDEHYTTARDLCLIACRAMQNEIFKEVVSTRSYSGDFKSFTNKNKLLSTLDGANGVKTGYTERAGRCLVSSAARGDMDVVCVVLNCYDMYERSSRIIESCFNEYSLCELSEDTVFNYKGRACTPGKQFKFAVKKDAEIEYKLVDPESADDDAVAKLEIFEKNDLIFSHNLYKLK